MTKLSGTALPSCSVVGIQRALVRNDCDPSNLGQIAFRWHCLVIAKSVQLMNIENRRRVASRRPDRWASVKPATSPAYFTPGGDDDAHHERSAGIANSTSYTPKWADAQIMKRYYDPISELVNTLTNGRFCKKQYKKQYVINGSDPGHSRQRAVRF